MIVCREGYQVYPVALFNNSFDYFFDFNTIPKDKFFSVLIIQLLNSFCLIAKSELRKNQIHKVFDRVNTFSLHPVYDFYSRKEFLHRQIDIYRK